MLWHEGNHIVCHAAGMDAITEQFSSVLQPPAANHTGLTGTYHLNLLYLPDNRRLEADAPPRRSRTQFKRSLGSSSNEYKNPWRFWSSIIWRNRPLTDIWALDR